MHAAMGLLVQHAALVLFAWVLLEQGGIPVPSVPLMLAAGTLSATGRLSLWTAIPAILIACLISDSAWFFLGRTYGTRVVNTLCKFSLEAATCVEKTQRSLGSRGAYTLLFAKFIPGLSTMAAPIAGQSRMPYVRFAGYDMLGSLLWALAWLLAGRFFGRVAERSQHFFDMLGHFAAALVLAMIVGIVLYRVVKRQRFYAELRGLRLEPSQLLAMIDDARREQQDPPFIVDLRHPLDVLPDPRGLPGAVRIGPDELKERSSDIPRDRDIVLYCTCPSEETSAKVALELRRMGIKRVRPLRGGLQGWKDAGYPLDTIVLV